MPVENRDLSLTSKHRPVSRLKSDLGVIVEDSDLEHQLGSWNKYMYILAAALVRGKRGKTLSHLTSPHSNTTIAVARAAIIVPSVRKSQPSQATGHGLQAANSNAICLFCRASCCLFHCSIRQRPKVSEYLRRFRRIHHALCEEDADHSLCRIDICRCAKAAVPTKATRCAEDFVTLNFHRHAEAPAAIGTEKDFGPCA